jgi:hypothetical protein
VTRVLGLCGAALPARNLRDNHESNPLGHWEPRKIVETHNRFLADAGLGWDDAFEYPRDIFMSGLADAYRDRLAELAAREFGGAELFVLKDPRLSRLMPLWRPVLKSLGAAPHAVIAVRNPLEVADSLRRRDGRDEYGSLLVWIRYMLAAERDTRDMPRCFVRHEQLVRDWRPVARTISERLAIPLALDDEEIRRQVDAFVRADLHRHRRSDAELYERVDIPECVKQVYRCCCDAAKGDRVNIQTLDAVAEALDEAEGFYRGTGPLAQWRDNSTNVIALRRQHLRRDALYAFAAAEMGSARQSKRQLDALMKTRSWKFTRPFRGACRLVARVARILTALLTSRPAASHPVASATP